MIEKSLLVISRTPLPKEVKTNLVPPLTHEEAAEFHASLLFDIVERAAVQLHAQPYVYFDPADARSDFEHVFRHASFEFKLKPAIGAKFSDKVSNAVDNIFSDGTRRLVYLDVDSAILGLQLLRNSFDLLSLDDDVVVLAPDTTEQLCLVGLKKPHAQIFDALNSKNPFDVAMKIASPIAAMLFTLGRSHSTGDLTGLRRLYNSFIRNGQTIESARRTTDFLLGIKEKYGEI